MLDGAEQATDLTTPVAPTDPGAGAPTQAPTTPTAPPTTPTAPAASTLDADGVRMLLPSATGTSFQLGTNDPSNTAGFLIENHVAATPQTLGSLNYWNTAAFNFSYSAGGTGKTTRLHIVGGPQNFTWRTQRLPLDPHRPAEPGVHGVRPRPRHLRRRAGHGDPQDPGRKAHRGRRGPSGPCGSDRTRSGPVRNRKLERRCDAAGQLVAASA